MAPASNRSFNFFIFSILPSKEFSVINSFGITVKTVSDTPRNEKNLANNEEMKAIEYFENYVKALQK